MRFLSFIIFLLFLSPVSFAEEGDVIYQSSEGEIVLNGEGVAYGAGLIVDESDYAYEEMKEDGVHIIFNGKVMGKGFHPQISKGKILFEREINFKNVIVFEGKVVLEYGLPVEGFDPILKDGHYVFFNKAQDDRLRDTQQGKAFVYYDGKYYCNGAMNTIKEKIYFSGNNVICEEVRTLKGETKTFILFNGIYISEGVSPDVSKTHYKYIKTKLLGTTSTNILVVDGKELEEGADFQFSDESFIYFRKNNAGTEELVFNGNNLGVFTTKDDIILKDGQVVFFRTIKEKQRNSSGVFVETDVLHLFHNGVDKGFVDDKTKVFISGKYVAFERTIKGFDYTEDTPKVKDITYVVFDGKVRSKNVVPESLKMEDGVFAFAKEFDVSVGLSATVNADGKYDILYEKKKFIYKGETDGTVKKLSEGDSTSIVVQGGRVAYTLKDTVSRQYFSEGVYKTKDVEVDVIYIDSGLKGAGDISSIYMKDGNYVFTDNSSGTDYLVINGKKQITPGTQAYFLMQDKNINLAPESGSNAEVRGRYSGVLFKIGSKYYLKQEKSRLHLMPAKGVNLSKFMRKSVVLNAKKTSYKYNVSGKKFTAYKVTKIQKSSSSSISTSSSNSKTFRGVLSYTNSSFYLRGVKKTYKLKFASGISTTDMNEYVGAMVKLKLKNKGDYWEVQGLPE